MSAIAANGDDHEDRRGAIDRHLKQLSDEERDEFAKAVQGLQRMVGRRLEDTFAPLRQTLDRHNEQMFGSFRARYNEQMFGSFRDAAKIPNLTGLGPILAPNVTADLSRSFAAVIRQATPSIDFSKFNLITPNVASVMRLNIAGMFRSSGITDVFRGLLDLQAQRGSPIDFGQYLANDSFTRAYRSGFADTDIRALAAELAEDLHPGASEPRELDPALAEELVDLAGDIDLGGGFESVVAQAQGRAQEARFWQLLSKADRAFLSSLLGTIIAVLYFALFSSQAISEDPGDYIAEGMEAVLLGYGAGRELYIYGGRKSREADADAQPETATEEDLAD